MKKLVFAIGGAILGIILSCTRPAHAQSELPGPWSFSRTSMETIQKIHIATWSEACRVMKMQCRDIAMPRVGYALLDYKFGAFDVGSRTVLLDIRIFAQEVSAPILFHEMVHFLQEKREPLTHTGYLPFALFCTDEKEAHELTLAWTQERGIAKNDPRVRSWAVASRDYGCAP